MSTTDLTQLLNEQAILRVLASYNRHLDDGNVAALSDLFTDDGTLEAMGKRLAGREQLQAFMGAWATEHARPSTSHMLSNVVINWSNDANVAAAESDFAMIASDAEGGHKVLFAGRYHDRLRHESGAGWRIEQRRVVGLARGST